LIKRVLLFVIMLSLALSGQVSAAELGDGVIVGQVVNGTPDGASVAELEVTLKVFVGDDEVDSAVVQADSEGHFIFDGLSTVADYMYQVLLVFQGAEYTSQGLLFNADETEKSVEIIVYDSTTDDGSIMVGTAHTIISVAEGTLEINELLLFVNESDLTYIGEGEQAQGSAQTLMFTLPEGVSQVQSGMGLMDCCVVPLENGFADTMPVLPGTRQVTYSYGVSYSSGRHTLRHQINYPVVDYQLFVQGENIQVLGAELTDEELVEVDNKRFSHLSGHSIPAGTVLTIELADLPQAGSQNALLWALLVLGVLAGGAGLGYVMRRRTRPVETESLDEARQRLLIELARLDDDHESGQIPEEDYRNLRDRKKAQLLELTQRVRETRT
jgi:LPXTG-motif cell wall-anchored protein